MRGANACFGVGQRPVDDEGRFLVTAQQGGALARQVAARASWRSGRLEGVGFELLAVAAAPDGAVIVMTGAAW
ncbi:hypothetical protein [Streptomyces sp. NPDC059479]|uniref:hypothetical protein n=1 Tax=Streptomyces sp. NPDC059479 TaxID=3346848 RepID=UPI00368EF1AC